MRTDGNNPPVCAPVPPLALGTDERATSSLTCEDRDFNASFVTDPVSIVVGDPALGRIEGVAKQGENTIGFTYVLDGPTEQAALEW